jgi:hypothetical protein
MLFELVGKILLECWGLLVEAAPYVLFGFLAAGLLKAFLPVEMVARHLGSKSVASVLKASLFGIPLPLCSCGVIPAAIGLRRQGASKGASAAFLVSTPETGVDSIAVTWALLDPIMTLVRPLAAFVTATVTGLLINALPEEESPAVPPAPAPGCGCSGSACGETPPPPPSLRRRLADGLGYAFGELLGDIGKWLLLGILLAGLIAALVPAAFFARHLGGEFTSLFLMLLAGVPMYICASASTPIAAALVLKGLSPGAALVFLLAGPATNAATLAVVARFWGRKITAVYLASIALCSLVSGYLVNRLYVATGADITTWVHHGGEKASSPWAALPAVLLLILIGRNFLPRTSGKSCGDC